MEEKESITFVKNFNRKHFFNILNKRSKDTNFICFIIFNIIFFLFLIIILILLFDIKEYKKRINKHKKKFHLNFSNFEMPKRIFHYKDDIITNTNKNKIHVSYSLDDQLIYPTLVSMTSGLENINNSTNILIYHLLLSYNFNTSKIYIFESLKDNYEVKINYYIIPPIFNSSGKWTEGTDCVYYKIILPLMFPDIKRMIYLDGDTLIRKDILEMYEYPFNDNYILGHPFYMPQVMDEYKINATHYINGGCLLFNIEKIREDKKDIDLLYFTFQNNSRLRFREQDSINYVFYPNIGFLPLKYGIYMIGDNNTFYGLSKHIRSPLNLTEGYEAVADPSIVHFSCCWPKVWENVSRNLFNNDKICDRYRKEFYYYAGKTKFYNKIYNILYNKIKN